MALDLSLSLLFSLAAAWAMSGSEDALLQGMKDFIAGSAAGILPHFSEINLFLISSRCCPGGLELPSGHHQDQNAER